MTRWWMAGLTAAHMTMLAATLPACGDDASATGAAGDAPDATDATGTTDAGGEGDGGTGAADTTPADAPDAAAPLPEADAGPVPDANAPGDVSVDVHAEDALTPAPDVPDASPADVATSDGGSVDTATPDTTEAPLDPATVPLRGSCPQETYLGGFLVEVQELFSVVDGKVLGAVDPNQVKDVVSDDGTCRLLRTEYPSCDPLCEPGFTCKKGGVCVPYPTQQDLGTVTVEGLEEAVVMTPQPPGNSYFDTELPHPAFLPGVAIRLSSTPGFAGKLLLYGVGSSPIQLAEPEWVVQDGAPLTFTWDPPPEGARTQVELRVTLDQHGNTPVSLQCELPDTGSATIPAAQITELLSYGISGFPNARVSRRTVDSVDITAGCVDLVVGAPVNPSVTISGHYPCSKPGDCPDGLFCNVAMETCE